MNIVGLKSIPFCEKIECRKKLLRLSTSQLDSFVGSHFRIPQKWPMPFVVLYLEASFNRNNKHRKIGQLT